MMSMPVSREIVSLQGALEEVNSRPHHMIAENSNDHGVHQAWRKGLIQWKRPAQRLVLPVEREDEEMSAITTFFNSKTMFIHLPPRVFEKHRPHLFLSFSIASPCRKRGFQSSSKCTAHASCTPCCCSWTVIGSNTESGSPRLSLPHLQYRQPPLQMACFSCSGKSPMMAASNNLIGTSRPPNEIMKGLSANSWSF